MLKALSLSSTVWSRLSFFPSSWKTAQITPIFKSEDPTLVLQNNIHSPSNIKNLGKKSLQTITSNNILSNFQYGFQ